MIANYEKRYFDNGENVWVGRYSCLNNILHWHFECEIIHVVSGPATIMINNNIYNASKDDCFFCAGGDIHYINSGMGSIINIIIFNSGIVKEIIHNRRLAMPRLSEDYFIPKYVELIAYELSKKEPLYNYAVDNYISGLVISVFRSETVEICRNERKKDLQFFKNLIDKINTEFAYISFEDAVSFSGYSAAYFSKLFKKKSGMTFSKYLNIVRVENAVEMVEGRNANTPITDIALKCGFSTVRNFNRVFRDITGFAPNSLPKGYVLNKKLKIFRTDDFNPTIASSRLI